MYVMYILHTHRAAHTQGLSYGRAQRLRTPPAKSEAHSLPKASKYLVLGAGRVQRNPFPGTFTFGSCMID